MQRELNFAPSITMRESRRHCYFFLGYLIAFLALGAVTFLAMLYGLKAADSLPAAPLTGTYCIDEKFKFLAEQDLENTDLLAVGSSVTWRNLDLRPFVTGGLSKHPLNAAPCYLHMHQMVFLTEFLLDRLSTVQTLISVVAPRDFENCSEADRAFFSPEQATPYIFRGASPLVIYATNFRPIQLIRDASRVEERRSKPRSVGPLVMGPYGSGPIEGTSDWTPAPLFDDKCFDALAEFDKMLASRGVKLIVVSFPLSPKWHSRYDPEGDVERTFEARLRASLSHDGSTFISSRSFSLDRSLYFDAVHFQWPAAQAFSSLVADRLGPILTASSRQ